jgi:type I restriction enzyme S subunit
MSYLDKLLQGVEVEWKTIDNLFHVKNGYTPSKSNQEYWTNGTIPWFRMEDIRKNGRVLSDSIQHVSESAVKGQLIPENSLLMSTTATIGEHALILVPYLTNQQITNFSLKTSYADKVSIKYLFYCFFDFGKWSIENANRNGGLSIIGTNKLKEYTIPIPPLAVQNKIVSILDNFTELTARKKQYIFYREQFFEFDDVEIKREPLGIIGEFQRGKRFVKDDMLSEGVPCIHYGEMYTYYGTWANKSKSFLSEELVERKNLRIAENGDVVIVAAGETIEDIGLGTAWLGNEGVVIHDACFSFRSPLNPKYVAYFTRTKQFHDQIKKHISSGKISAINARGLEKVLIPVPSPEEQARIVSILDKFDTLTTSISEGLPKEIELRKKQYEYYRDKLLTFPKENTEI